MASSFLYSLTDLLGGSSDHSEKKLHKKKSRGRSKERKTSEINQNIVDPSAGSITVKASESKRSRSKTKVSASKSSGGGGGIGAAAEFMNAESLDRAIVHRLQSKVSFTSTPGTSTSKSRTRSKENKVKSQPSEPVQITTTTTKQADFAKACSSQNSLLENALFAGDTLFPGVHGSNSKLGESSSSELASASGLGSSQSEGNGSRYKSFLEKMESSGGFASNSTTSGENRGLVYKNAQFSLENPSREALLPDVSRKDDDHLFSLNLPDFSVPRHRRSSTMDDQYLSNDPTPASPISRRRSMSKSPLRAPLFGPSYTGSNANLGEELFETTMNNIIDKGGDEFKNKYSSWVWEAFRTHLTQLKNLLLDEFNHKMKETLDEREQEVITLQKQYRDKLAEFDVTTEGFQKMIDTLYQENQKVLKAKDFVIEKLKKEFMECKRHFEHDLIRQMQSYRKEAEMEKMELQKRNDELMMIMLTDASKCGMEEAFKREIESLHKMIKALTTQNDVLHQQLEEATNTSHLVNKKNIEAYHMQLDMAGKEVSDLKRKLQQAEREKEDLAVSHNEEIAKLNRRFQETSTRYDHQLRDAGEEVEALKKKFQKEAKELKQKLQNQDNQHVQVLNQVKQQYGGQVESLSKAVAQLKAELTMNNAKRYPQ